MMSSRDELIARLSDNLQPALPGMSITLKSIIWWLLSWVYVVTMTLVMGPLRPGVLIQLATSPQFLIESLIGLLLSLSLTVAAWQTATPGALSRRWAYLSLTLAVLWLSNYLVGFIQPALEPSMSGKREHCYFETLLYTLPPSLVACTIVARKLLPLKSLRTGLLIGLAAGTMPALFMQFACMYEIRHILERHLLPGVLTALIPMLVLPLLLIFLKRKPNP